MKKLPNLKEPSKPTKFDKRRAYSLMPEQKKNCGCGQDPCKTYGKKDEAYEPHYMYKGTKNNYKAKVSKKKKDHDRLAKLGYNHDDPETKKVEEEITKEEAVTVIINGKTMDISHLSGKTPYDKTQSFNKIFAKNYSKHNTKAPNYTFHHKGKQIGQSQSTGNIHYKDPRTKELDAMAKRHNKLFKQNEEVTKFDNVDPMNSVIAIRGIGTMTIPQALTKVAEMSEAVSKLAQELDHKDIQDNIPRYMDLLATYNNSIQEAYKELAQQRKRGGTKSKGIDKDISEAKDVSYENWDHPESAEYSKFLEKTFGAPDEFTNEQTVWHNIDGFKRVVCRDEYILHCCPAPHYDFVYSYVDLEVPENLSDELANCSGSILIDHLKNEVGARCGSLTANATTLNFVMDVVAGRTEPTPEEYEKRILGMKDMFSKGEKYELDWWPDKASDADPKNPFYESRLDEKCWPGYKKKGMKTHYGKRVPNCVKSEGVVDDYIVQPIKKMVTKRTKTLTGKEKIPNKPLRKKVNTST